jgi:hypothetical protein
MGDSGDGTRVEHMSVFTDEECNLSEAQHKLTLLFFSLLCYIFDDRLGLIWKIARSTLFYVDYCVVFRISPKGCVANRYREITFFDRWRAYHVT